MPSHTCDICNKLLFSFQSKSPNFQNDASSAVDLKQNAILCSHCFSCLHKNKIPTQAYEYNKLKPGAIPKQLQNLWVIEKRLIALIQLFMTLVILPGGQVAQKGRAINFNIDFQSQTEDFLTSVINFDNIVTISCERPNSVPTEVLARATNIINALKWLKTNNHLYENLNLSSIEHETYSAFPRGDSERTNGELSTDIVQEEYGTIPANYTPLTDVTSDMSTFNLPAVKSQPINIKNVDHGEEKAFPWLFPDGKNGISETRPSELSVINYYHSRLYNRDPRWRCDLPYLMSGVNQVEWEQLLSAVSIYCRTYKPSKNPPSNVNSRHTNYEPISAQDLNNLNSESLSLDTSYMFTKKIRGTAAYWKDVLFNLLAMIKTLGPPDFFLTLSCNDNWPELHSMLATDSKNSTVPTNPFMATLAFERRWHAFLKNVLKGKNGPLQKITDYFVRVEFQARGSPHLHIFLWTSYNLGNRKVPNAEMIQIIDKTISTSLPNESSNPLLFQLVKQFQTHHHTFTCSQGKPNYCRFGFPHSVCANTRICLNVDTIATCRGRFYETKRTKRDTLINAYNSVILHHWRANHDIQVVAPRRKLCILCL